MEIVEVTDDRGAIVARDWLRKSEGVHRQLRPALPGAYEDKMKRVFAGGGRMSIATHRGEVAGLAVYRMHENTAAGRLLYVDDLVTDERCRSEGVGRTVLSYLERKARTAGLDTLSLDSGVQRDQAHKFYFREGMIAAAFHFIKKLA